MHAQLSAPSGPRASPIPRAKNPRCSSVHLAQHPNEPGWSASTRPPPAAPTLVLTRPPVSHCLRAAVRPTAWETPREVLHRLVPALTTACCNCLPLVRALVGCCGECSVGQEPFVQVDGSAAELGPALTLQPCLIERERFLAKERGISRRISCLVPAAAAAGDKDPIRRAVRHQRAQRGPQHSVVTARVHGG